MHRLDGQVALITGAGGPQGIGFATAKMLGELGAAVMLSATTERVHQRAAELRGVGIDAHAVVADLMAPGAADHVVLATLDQFSGRLQICINNAGMVAVGSTPTETSFVATSDDEWHDGLERNLTSCFAVTRAAVRSMRPHGYGRIVNVASTSGAVQAFVGDVAYHAAKAGMVGLTRAVALECAAEGVTVNAVAPGWIATGSQTASERSAGASSPIGRSGTPDEVAAAIVFLAAPSSGFITGQLLVVDGGNSLPEDRNWRP